MEEPAEYIKYRLFGIFPAKKINPEYVKWLRKREYNELVKMQNEFTENYCAVEKGKCRKDCQYFDKGRSMVEVLDLLSPKEISNYTNPPSCKLWK